MLAVLVAPAGIASEPSKAKPAAQAKQVAQAKPAKRAKRDPLTPAPLTELMVELKTEKRSKSARALKKAWSDLKAENAAGARKSAATLLKDRRYGDYSAWITGLAWRLEASRSKGPASIAAAEKALAQYHSIEAAYPGSPILKTLPRDMAAAEWLVGDAQVAAKHWSAAQISYERALTRLVEASSLGSIPAPSLKGYAQACESASTETCLAWIQRLGATYPRNSDEARAIAAVFPSALDKVRAPSVPRVNQAYKAPDLDQAAVDAAYALVVAGKDRDAEKAFAQFNDTYPRSAQRQRARFWVAQIQLKRKESDAARKIFADIQKDSPLSWYGLLSALANGADIEAAMSGEEPEGVATDSFLHPSELTRLHRAQELLAEGAPELAAVELQDWRPRDALSSPFLLYLARLDYEAGAYQACFIVLSELISRGFAPVYSSEVARMVFPSPYFEIAKRYGAEYQVDPVLILSLIKQESAFNATVQSNVGATGLMQLMPSTAHDTDREVKRQELVLAERNIRVGAKYLKQLLNRFKGNIVLALAGYNAGPSAVNRWVRENPSRSMLEFVEAIPYRETRDYVGSIIRNYYWYSKRLGTPVPKDLAFFWGAVAPAEKNDDVDPAANPSASASPTPPEN